FGGRALVLALLPVWLFLWLAVPLPLGLDQNLITSLQPLTARGSSVLLDQLGVFHVRAGNVIEVPGKRLMVEDACSGIHSLFAVLACTSFFALWSGRPGPWALVLIGLSLGWVL